jgi:prepilin-type N-terminal cleavage/methylation domain-containing protein
MIIELKKVFIHLLKHIVTGFQNKRGFTLIELLVVIAIIGVLSSVVLASLGSARNKGADSAVKSNLRSIKTIVDIIYDVNQTTPPYNRGYNEGGSAGTGICDDSKVIDARNALAKAVGVTYASVKCAATATGWAVKAPLSGGTTYWCIDHNGIGASYSGTPSATPACP